MQAHNRKHGFGTYALIATLSMQLTSVAFAADPAKSNVQLDAGLNYNVEYFKSKQGDYKNNLLLKETQVTLGAVIADRIRAKVVLNADRPLVINGVEQSKTFDMAEAVREATIEVALDKETGQPVVLVIGKQFAAFGQQATALPYSNNSPSYDAGHYERAIGMTVALNKNIFDLFDKAEISAIASRQDETELGKGAGGSIRLTKAFTKAWSAQASAMNVKKDNLDGTDRNDSRGSIGVVYDDGSWSAYAEGLALHGYSEGVKGMQYGATVGGAKAFGPGKVVAEWNVIETQALAALGGETTGTNQRATLGYSIPIGRYVGTNLSIMPNIVRVENEGMPSDNQYGLTVSGSIGKGASKKEN
ncbi:hypothetical protein K2X30_11550 [bacterium]|nr:hypothetical protein [bacterium]